MRFLRTLTFIAVVAVVVGVGIAIWRGAGPLPDPEGCSAEVAGHFVGLDTDQGQVAALITSIGIERGLPARAVSIALATGFQESKLRNLTAGDRDSVGIFQQRPSQGWGSRAEILRPSYAINRFYDALVQVSGYEHLPITVAAQRVQHSAYPSAYEAHAADARALASALTGYSAGGKFTCVVHSSSTLGTAAKVEHSLTAGYGSALSISRGPRQDVLVTVPRGAAGDRLGWAVAQYVVAYATTLHAHAVTFDDREWQVGRASEKGWTHTSASSTQVRIEMG